MQVYLKCKKLNNISKVKTTNSNLIINKSNKIKNKINKIKVTKKLKFC